MSTPISRGEKGMVRRKTPSELEQAEIKYDALVEKRNQCNAEANLVRQERDQLHERRRGMMSSLKEMKEARQRLLEQVRDHKARRNQFQAEAKELLELKKKLKVEIKGDLLGEIKTVRRRVQELEIRQQTTPMPVARENELLEEMRALLSRLKEMERVHETHGKLLDQVGEVEARIDELFKRADEEHQRVIQISAAAQEIQGQLIERVKEISLLIAEANKHHEAFLTARAKADEFHQKAQEMREKILSVREQRRQEIHEARKVVQDHRRAVREALDDRAKVERAADEALENLLRKGRIALRP